MYERMVPVYGEPREVQAFFDANSSWIGKQRILEKDLRYGAARSSAFKKIFELLLGGSFGAWVEERLRRYQIARIESGLPLGPAAPHIMKVIGGGAERIQLQPLIVYTDEELEFHPHPAVIEVISSE